MDATHLWRPLRMAQPPSGRRSVGAMGLNPHGKMRKDAADYAMVAGAIVVCALLLAWAFLG